MQSSDRDKIVKGFSVHGLIVNNTSGDQIIGDCPFCDKASHFYLNKKNGLWDCKKCGKKGNFQKFLHYVNERNVPMLQGKVLRALARDRKLPTEAFKGLDIGFDGSKYTLGVRNFEGKIIDVRHYKFSRSGVYSTPGIQYGGLKGTGLYQAHKIPGNQDPIYVCEGEWDAIALNWLLRKVGKRGVVVGVPGASTFKEDWAEHFQDRRATLLYDNDKAGDLGEHTARDRIEERARSMKYIKWPTDLPSGFDIRDLVTRLGVAKGKPKFCWRKLNSLISSKPRKTPKDAEATKDSDKNLKPITNRALLRVYKKWLKLQDDTIIKVMFATVFANRLQGDPVWLFVIGPPGSGKSELIMSLSRSSKIVAITSLTPHSLISGAVWARDDDPSLLSKLNNKILTVKDFTAIMTQHPNARDEIFGTLRDIYDGKAEKVFGTGIRRAYKVRFGFLAGCTSVVEKVAAMNGSLGERFLKIRIGDNRKGLTEEQIIRRAMGNVNRETSMRDQMERAAERCIARKMPKKIPTVSRVIENRIIRLAQFTAALRGVVEREKYTNNVQFKPQIEVGTRLAKQLKKLAIGLAVFEKRKQVTFEDYAIIKKVALDTTPDRVEEIIKQIAVYCKTVDDVLSTAEIEQRTKLPLMTCRRILEDLELLRIVKKTGTMSKQLWTLNKRIRKLITKGRIYNNGRH